MSIKIKTVQDLHRVLDSNSCGYGINFITSDGALLCEECVHDNLAEIEGSINDERSDGWRVEAAESGDMFENGERCDHCNKWLDSYHKPFEDGAHWLVVDIYGIYIPKYFMECCDHWEGIKEDARKILLEGPEHALYWDAWGDVLEHAYWKDKDGTKYTLYQDGDLWAIEEDTWIGG